MIKPELINFADPKTLVSLFSSLSFVFLLSKQQIAAILARDHNKCQFPFPHNCKGKKNIHHINGVNGDKRDCPENLITVCRQANWRHIHNGDKNDYVDVLKQIARKNTETASEEGWAFPE